ncbi:spindle assembly abnormal protein 6 homolog [Stigmatopora nigra]
MSSRQQTVLSDEHLFSKVLEVIVRCRDCIERKTHIRITIALQSSKSTLQKHDLLVRLTDDTDPYFLFLLVLSEEDFRSLKEERGMVIEFRSFPERLIEYVEKCRTEQSSSESRYDLLLSCNSPSLDGPAELTVVETNSFIKYTPVCLRFTPASDKYVKEYVANSLTLLKAEKESLEVKLEKTEEDFNRRLNNTQQMLFEKSKEMERLRSEWISQSTLLTSRHSDELRTERERLAEVQSRLQLQIQQKQQEQETANQRESQMKERLEFLETKCSYLTNERNKDEATIIHLKSKLADTEEECQRGKREETSLKCKNDSLNTALHEMEQQRNRAREAQKTTEQQKEIYKDRAEIQESQIKKLESRVEFLSGDVTKATDIIRKFQHDVSVLRDKNDMKNEALVKQEDVLMETLAKLESTEEKLRIKDEENVNLTKQLEASLQKLSENKTVLQDNDNMIQFLNRELNKKFIPEPSENILAGPRTHCYAQVMKSTPTVEPIHTHTLDDGAGLDKKYFTRQESIIPVSRFPDAFVPKECPPLPRTKVTLPSAYFPS